MYTTIDLFCGIGSFTKELAATGQFQTILGWDNFSNIPVNMTLGDKVVLWDRFCRQKDANYAAGILIMPIKT